MTIPADVIVKDDDVDKEEDSHNDQVSDELSGKVCVILAFEICGEDQG
jgi:hypothetical protein